MDDYNSVTYEEKEKGSGLWWKILIGVVVLSILIIVLIKFCGKSDSADKKYAELKTKVCAAAETYITSNADLLDKTKAGDFVTIKYDDLVKSGLLESKIENPYYKKENTEQYYSLEDGVKITVNSALTLNCDLIGSSEMVVKVKDTTPPVIKLNGEIQMNYLVGTEFEDPKATATDEIDGDLTSKIEISGTVDSTKAGTYTLTYKVTDEAGNTATQTRTIIYEEYPDFVEFLNTPIDKETPTITLKGANPYCMIKGTKYVEPGAIGKDNIDGAITKNILVTSIVFGEKIGSFRVTYKLKDSSGNEAIAYRAVVVTDKCPDLTETNTQ